MVAEFRTIPGWPDYEVSEEGAVRSVDRTITDSLGRTRLQRGVEKATWVDSGGYVRAELSHNGKRFSTGVHRLVALAFLGTPEEGQEVRHLDGDSQNNHVSNLAWGTHSENIQDTVRMGRYANRNTTKTHCPKGHTYSGRNSRGDRVCNPCRAEAQRRYKQRKAKA